MEWFSENAAMLTGLGGLATVVAALVAVATLMRAGLDSASRTRPYVVVEYRIPKFSYKRMTLVVRNAGPTAARGVKVTFEPPFQDSEEGGRLGRYVARRYAQPISVLGPGQELTSIVVADSNPESVSDVPELLTATVSYDAPWWRFRPYRDTFVLQRVIYTQQIISSSSESTRGRLRAIAQSLKSIETEQRNRERALEGIEAAVHSAAILLAPAQPGVAWRARHVRGDRYAIDNVGSDVAHGVVVSAAKDHMVGPMTDGEPRDIAPRESIEFLASGTLASGAPAVRVAWAQEPDLDTTHEIELSL